MKKKILKNLCKVFICLLLIYLIYVVANIIYANNRIDEVIENVVLNSGEEGVKNFSYQKKKVFYFLGKVHYEYEICLADPTDVFKSGTYLEELLNNFDEKYIDERRLLKNVAKKAGTYDDENEEIGFEIWNYSQHFSDKSFYNLLKKTVYQEEREYTGNKIEVFPVTIKYNIFTHEFKNLDSFSDMKNGTLFIREAYVLFSNSDISKNESLIAMYKSGERELRLIELNDKVVSVYENFENENPFGSDFESYIENYVENKYEKYIIENNLSVDDAITYLKSQGYKFGRNIILENDEYKKVELVFDGESLLWFDKESITNEVEEKVNYLFENNTSKAEIIRELENMGYYQRKEYFYQEPQNLEWLRISYNDNDYDLINEGYVQIEKVFFYNPEEGYIITYFDNENIVLFADYGIEILGGKLEQFISNKLTKAEVIEELRKYGFEIEI